MKYCGVIGFADTVETEPGVFEDSIVEESFGHALISKRLFLKYLNYVQHILLM